MSVSLGNLALLLDISSPRSITLDRKARADTVLNLPPKRDLSSSSSSSSCCCYYVSEGEARSRLVVARGKSNGEQNGVDFEAESSDEEGGFGDGESFEKKMRRRVKEFEERRELEKKAEELQSRIDDDDGGEDITEEEKRMRVRKELEKVSSFPYTIELSYPLIILIIYNIR